MTLFQEVIKHIYPCFKAGEGSILSNIGDHANELLTSDMSVPFTNREVKMLLLHHYVDDIIFSLPQEANKASMVFLKTFTAEQMADIIRSSDPIHLCANVLRKSIMDIDSSLQGK